MLSTRDARLLAAQRIEARLDAAAGGAREVQPLADATVLALGTKVVGVEFVEMVHEETGLLVSRLHGRVCDCPGAEPIEMNCGGSPVISDSLVRMFWTGYEMGVAE